jgi:hypothetical protein
MAGLSDLDFNHVACLIWTSTMEVHGKPKWKKGLQSLSPRSLLLQSSIWRSLSVILPFGLIQALWAWSFNPAWEVLPRISMFFGFMTGVSVSRFPAKMRVLWSIDWKLLWVLISRLTSLCRNGGPDWVREFCKWQVQEDSEWHLVCRTKKSYADVVKSAPQWPAETIFKRISFPADYFEKNFQSEFSSSSQRPKIQRPSFSGSGDRRKFHVGTPRLLIVYLVNRNFRGLMINN